MNMTAKKQPVVSKHKKDTRIARAKARFLQALRQLPNVSTACELVGLSRSYAYAERQTDKAFREQWDEALERATDKLEQRAFELAQAGCPQLVMFLLKAHRKSVYGDAPRTALASPPTVYFSTRYVAVHDNGAHE
jgi:hypothetical protein